MCYKLNEQSRIAEQVELKAMKYPLFLRNFFSTKKSAKTSRSNFGVIDDLFNWLIKNEVIEKVNEQELNKITVDNVITYFNNLQKGVNCKPNSLDTIKTKRAIMHKLWNYMIERKIVNENIFKDETLKNLFKPETTNMSDYVKIPSEKQIEKFIINLINEKNDIHNARNLAIVRLFMGSGIRSEELIGLDLIDLHFDDNEPYITVLSKGNQKDKDMVYVSKDAIESVNNYLKYRIKLNGIKDKKALFISDEMTRISKTAIDNFFMNKSDGEITPHMLRHWYGSRLYNKTHNIVLVQQQLRHRDVKTTVKYYVRVDKKELVDAAYNM